MLGLCACRETASWDHVRTLAPIQKNERAAKKSRRSSDNCVGAVTSIAVHASGCVLMSAGKDRALSMWNLSSGKGRDGSFAVL